MSKTTPTTPKQEEIKTKFVKGAELYNSIKEDPNLTDFQKYAHLFPATEGAAVAMNPEELKDTTVFFTDILIWDLQKINEETGEVITDGMKFIRLYDRKTMTCYYTMGSGLTMQLLKLKEQGIPAHMGTRLGIQIFRKTFKDKKTGMDMTTFDFAPTCFEEYQVPTTHETPQIESAEKQFPKDFLIGDGESGEGVNYEDTTTKNPVE